MSNALSIIDSSRLLSTEDNSSLLALIDDTQESFATAQVFRTITEMMISVLNDAKHPTADSKYWQAVREQDVFVTELVGLSYEYKKLQIELRKLLRKLEAETDDLEREFLVVEIEHKEYTSMIMARAAHHRVREIVLWAEIKSQLKPMLQYGTEDVNLHQLDAFRIRFTNEAKLVNDNTPIADARNILGLAKAANK